MPAGKRRLRKISWVYLDLEQRFGPDFIFTREKSLRLKTLLRNRTKAEETEYQELRKQSRRFRKVHRKNETSSEYYSKRVQELSRARTDR
jgi:hypothetical protein